MLSLFASSYLVGLGLVLGYYTVSTGYSLLLAWMARRKLEAMLCSNCKGNIKSPNSVYCEECKLGGR